jgi:hypothetical protein
MRRILFTLLAVAGLVPVAGAATLTVDRLFEAPDLQGETLRALRFSPDGRLISYLKPSATEPEVFDLWAYDIGRRQHRLLVAARTLAPQERALSAEEEARRERARTAALRGIVDYAWSPRGDACYSRWMATCTGTTCAPSRAPCASSPTAPPSKPTRGSRRAVATSASSATRTCTCSNWPPAASAR